MIDFLATYGRFEDIRRALVQVENDMLNHNARTSAHEHALYLKLLRMAESECQSLLVMILRIRGGSASIRRHDQESAVSWSAGVESSTGQVTMTTTDVFSNTSESFVMNQEQFSRLVNYLNTVREQCPVQTPGASLPGTADDSRE